MWEWERLRETTTYVTAGVYRLRGRDKPWSAILKIIHMPQPAGGLPDERRTKLCTPSHPDYWKREALVYRSRLLRDLPRGVAAPRCFAVEERGDDTVWLWLEDIVDLHRGAAADTAWPFPERFLLAARYLGRLGGTFLARGRPPSRPWLSRGETREWLARTGPPALDLLSRPGIWDHPALRRAFPSHPSEVAGRLLRLWEEREAFLTALERMPQTLCHRDPLPPFNLIARRVPGDPHQAGAQEAAAAEEETVLIDWAGAGIGPVGEDLAHLTEGSGLRMLARHAGHPDGDADMLSLRWRALDAYAEGLLDVGSFDQRTVRFAFLACAALQRTFRGARLLLEETLKPSPSDDEIERNAALMRVRLELADEARRLLPT